MSLGDDKRLNIQGELDFSTPVRGEAPERRGKEIESLAAAHEHESPASTNRMMEEIGDWENLKAAMGRVKANKGSAGAAQPPRRRILVHSILGTFRGYGIVRVATGE